MIIHLIRHTTPAIDKGVCYGQSDLELAPTFFEERDRLLSKLSMPYEALFTSPLKRCSRLADSIDARRKSIEPRIMEYNFGDWEMKPWSELKSSDTGGWMDNFVAQPAPGGDSMLSMQARVMEFWAELLEHSYESVAVVTHSGVQRLIHADILSTPLSDMFRLQLNFGAVLEVTHHRDHGFQTIKHL